MQVIVMQKNNSSSIVVYVTTDNNYVEYAIVASNFFIDFSDLDFFYCYGSRSIKR